MGWFAAVVGDQATAALCDTRANTRLRYRGIDGIAGVENNPERRFFLPACLLPGASQSNLTNWQAGNVDWENQVISFKCSSEVPHSAPCPSAVARQRQGNESDTGIG